MVDKIAQSSYTSVNARGRVKLYKVFILYFITVFSKGKFRIYLIVELNKSH